MNSINPLGIQFHIFRFLLFASVAFFGVAHLVFYFGIVGEETTRFFWENWLSLSVAYWVVSFWIPLSAVLIGVRTMNRSLQGFLGSLNRQAQLNNQTSVMLNNSSNDLSEAANEQSAAVQQAVASMIQIRSMLVQTNSHVSEAKGISNDAMDRVKLGTQTMSKMEMAMRDVEMSNRQLEKVASIIHGIKEKTQVINDIVFKTQLLSFNASIEAARAGQYGRGFAVVAEEVGNLAQLSGAASKEIDELLIDSEKSVAEIVEAVGHKVRDGKNVSAHAVDLFREILLEISKISEKVDQVGDATQEQQRGIEQSSLAMERLGQTAEDNHSAAIEMKDLSVQSQELGQKIRKLSSQIQSLLQGRSARRSMNHKSADVPEKFPQNSETPPQNLTNLVDRIGSQDASSMRETSQGDSHQLDSIDADDPSFKKPS